MNEKIYKTILYAVNVVFSAQQNEIRKLKEKNKRLKSQQSSKLVCYMCSNVNLLLKRARNIFCLFPE